MLNESRKLNESAVTADFGPGKYFIGDICYSLREDLYDGFWGDQKEFEDGCFEVEGSKFCVAGTAHGDGGYMGSDNTTYGVDAGVIGIVPEALWKKEDTGSMESGGRIVDANTGISFVAEDGYFSIDVDGENITINTDDETEAHDDDEDTEYDEDDVFGEEDANESINDRDIAKGAEILRKNGYKVDWKKGYEPIDVSKGKEKFEFSPDEFYSFVRKLFKSKLKEACTANKKGKKSSKKLKIKKSKKAKK
jgi:hypothetical protein